MRGTNIEPDGNGLIYGSAQLLPLLLDLLVGADHLLDHLLLGTGEVSLENKTAILL